MPSLKLVNAICPLAAGEGPPGSEITPGVGSLSNGPLSVIVNSRVLSPSLPLTPRIEVACVHTPQITFQYCVPNGKFVG